MKTLIVVDMQNDFITGSLGSSEAQAIVPNVKRKIEEYIKRGDMIIFTRDTHRDNYLETNEGKHLPVKHCIRKTEGWEIVDGLVPYGANVLDKTTFGYQYWIDYPGLERSESIEFIGVCTDICVVSNVLILKAQYPEAEILVDASCCAGVTPEKHKAALEVMKSCQINVIGE